MEGLEPTLEALQAAHHAMRVMGWHLINITPEMRESDDSEDQVSIIAAEAYERVSAAIGHDPGTQRDV